MILITRTADPEWLDTMPTEPAPLDAAPRIPRERHVDGYGLAGLLICAVSAVGVAFALGALAALMF